jgi:hypothetical protein
VAMNPGNSEPRVVNVRGTKSKPDYRDFG